MPIVIMKNKALVKLNAPESRTRSGLFIPKEAQRDSFLASVIAVGPLQDLVKPGDMVIISNTSGIEVPSSLLGFESGSEGYLIVDSFEIMGIIEEAVDLEFMVRHEHQFYVIAMAEYLECVCGCTKRVIVDQ